MAGGRCDSEHEPPRPSKKRLASATQMEQTWEQHRSPTQPRFEFVDHPPGQCRRQEFRGKWRTRPAAEICSRPFRLQRAVLCRVRRLIRSWQKLAEEASRLPNGKKQPFWAVGQLRWYRFLHGRKLRSRAGIVVATPAMVKPTVGGVIMCSGSVMIISCSTRVWDAPRRPT